MWMCGTQSPEFVFALGYRGRFPDKHTQLSRANIEEKRETFQTLFADCAIDGFAEEIGVTGMTRGLFDEVEEHPAKRKMLPITHGLD